MKYLWDLIKEAKRYLFISAIIFIIGGWFGYQYDHLFREIIQQMLKQLEEAVKIIGSKNDPLYTGFFIFKNNLFAALFMLGMGVVLFFLPMVTLFSNGLAVGFVLKTTANQGISPVDMFIYAILPHGILELTAIIVAAGMGTFLGMRLVRWLFGYQGFFSHLLGSNRGDMRGFWAKKGQPYLIKKVISLFFLILALTIVLLVAAFIESYITPVMMQKFIVR